MSQAAIGSPMMFGDADGSTNGAIRWLSPALIGLSAPIVFGLMMFPQMLNNARSLLMPVLLTLLLVCVGAYTLSVLVPGRVARILVDRRARELELTSEGLFASKRRIVAFDDVAALSMTKQYDDDGYVYESAALRLADGEVIALPPSMSAADVVVARQALGKAPASQRRR